VRDDEHVRLEASRRIGEACERLAGCIDEVLLLLTISTGGLRLDPVPILVAPAVRAAIANVAPAYPTHALELEVDDAELEVLADAQRLPELMTRLLLAIAAAQPADSYIHVRISGAGRSALVAVEATRPWMPGEATRLTLDCARRLAELHRGAILVQERETGALVTLTLPLAGLPERAAAHRLLIVDDDESIRRLLRLTLPNEGFEIVEARDGSEALDRAFDDAPDLVVLDWRMPNRSGEEVLRELLKLHPGLPVIVLTAEQETRERETATALGARAFLTKPFSPLQLIAAVESLLEQPQPARKR
jgi:CheY-like chemotaxis protein